MKIPFRKNRMNPKVSIIVPVYNAEKYINKCIDSILSQTFTDFECILVNDYTPDGSGKICAEYAKNDKRIKLIHNEKNMGASLSRKIGLENSSGEYIQFIDSDDWVEPDMIEKLYEKALSENCDIVSCDFYIHNKGGNDKIIKQACYSSSDKIVMIRETISKKVKTFLWSKFVKKELLLLVEFPVYGYSEENAITIQNIHYSKKIGYINVPLYHYCINSQSLSKNKEGQAVRNMEKNKNWQMIINFLKGKYGDLRLFEPELSVCINEMKIKYILTRDTKNKKELFKIYPESRFYRYYFFYLIRKTMKKIFNKRGHQCLSILYYQNL